MNDFDAQEQVLQAQLKRYGGQQYQAPQGQMVGGRYVAPNFLEHIAAGLRGYGGIKGTAMAEQELKDLSGKRQTAMADALRGFSTNMAGAPEQRTPMQADAFDEADRASLGGNQNLTAATPGRKSDPYAAFASLASAPDSALRSAGTTGMINMSTKQAELAQAQAQQARQMQILQSAQTPQAALQAGVPFEMVKNYYESPNLGRDKVEFKDVGGQLVPVTQYGDTPQGVQPLTKTGNPFSDLVLRGADGNMTPNTPLVAVKGDIARKGRTSVTVNSKGPEAFDVELSKLDAKQLDQWRDKAEASRNSLSVAQRLKDAEAKGAYSGGLADQKLAAANLINGITGVEPKGLVGSQLYNAEASKLVLEHVKTLGANPSNADREFIEKTVPRLATSKEARQQMADFIEKSAQRTISTFDTMDQYARANRGLGGFKFPEMPAPSNAGGLSAQDAAALEWAKQNPNDQRAAKIMQRLGVQ
jgi:hypothetical protein